MVTVASDNPFPSVLFVEGDPEALAANPASGQRRLAVGTDHLLYLVDDTGTKTQVGGASGSVATDAIWDTAGDIAVATGANAAAKLAIGNAGASLARINGAVAWDSGTSFPTAATNDRYRRTDVRGGLVFIYDGTRWISEEMFSWTSGTVLGISADTNYTYMPLPELKVWLDSWDIVMFVAGTGVWEATLDKLDFEGDVTNVASKSSTGQTASRFYHYHEAIGAEVDSSGGNAANAITALGVWWNEVSGTATLNASATVFYRLIST